jgi:quinoprotein glucose dehydrogenase
MKNKSFHWVENLFSFSTVSIIFLLVSCRSEEEKKYSGWEVAKGSPENIHYSSLTQIDTSNVSKLKMAWEYHAGDSDNVNHSQIQCNPIIVKGILYAVSPKLKLFAIDAGTGKMKWEFNAIDSLKGNKKSFFGMNNVRGVSYWSDGKADERIYYAAGSDLYAIDAKTGKPITSFANQGKLDLHTGLDKDVSKLFVTATSPPMMVDDLLVIGSRVDEGSPAAPGHIRAFDVRTGERRWIFHTIPQPGEEGYESWDNKDAYKFTGGANAWSGFSYDKKRGILFAATGSASYDFYGGKRKGNNLYANSVLALDAKTGKKIWHFQTVHHDIWIVIILRPRIGIRNKRW